MAGNKKKTLNLQPPVAGVDSRLAYQAQPPYSAPAANNVRPDDTIEGRVRIGSRPGLDKSHSTALGDPTADEVRMLSDVSFVVSNTLKTRLCGSAAGDFYYENDSGVMTLLASGNQISSTQMVLAEDRLQKLYIADWDPVAATSAAARAPKIFDPVAGTLTLWSAAITAGTLPTGCPIIALYRDRLFLAGAYADPHQWFASRQGDPNDWDYAETDSGAAISGSNTEAGRIGEPVTALAPHSSNCMLMWGHTSTWLMQGDPGSGGRIINLSRTIGCVDKRAWCHAPANADGSGPQLAVFLTHDGVYVVPAGCEGEMAPQKLSRLKLPEELLAIDRTTKTITMAYDTRDQGIHLYVTDNAGGAADHWWIDWTNKSFWPVTLGSTNHDPFAIHARRNSTSTDSLVIMGCRDGYLRRYERGKETDDGTAFTSFIDYGPLPVNFEGTQDGILTELTAVLAAGSGDVNWAVRSGNNPESAFDATAWSDGKWTHEGLNPTVYPRVGGSDFLIRLSNGQSGTKWALEKLVVDIEARGRNRY